MQNGKAESTKRFMENYHKTIVVIGTHRNDNVGIIPANIGQGLCDQNQW